MSTASLPAFHDRRRLPGLEALAWVGLVFGVLAMASAALGPTGCLPGSACLTPQDFSAWVTAICSAVGAVTAAANGVAIVVHRWGRKPRKPRKPREKKSDAPANP